MIAIGFAAGVVACDNRSNSTTGSSPQPANPGATGMPSRVFMPGSRARASGLRFIPPMLRMRPVTSDAAAP